MKRLEVLCATMHQNDFSKIKDMNINCDVIFANQADRTTYETYEFDSNLAKMITTTTRGVGINRNIALMYATAEICVLADDDVIYNDDMCERIISEFDSHPDADIMIFHFDTDDILRKQQKYYRTKKWHRIKGAPWGGIRIAFKLASIKKANIWFTTLFGGGAIFPSGEDSMFLLDAQKSGLRIYVSKETIGNVSFEESTWFTGFDEKLFCGKGAFYQAVHPKTKYAWMLYLAIRTEKKTDLRFKNRMKAMCTGATSYKICMRTE